MKAIKNSAIIYSGYDYQTLHGVLLLAKWINNPTEYQRICFEADGDKDEAPQGIDDIICERSDGRIDYRQVKFTPSPFKEENKLSWDWLLKISGKTDRSRSILKKISDAVKRVPDGKIGDVILLTNKRPDRNIDKCLNEHRIIYENIDQSVLAEITDQLGDEKTVKAFFSILQIHHSDADYPSVERALRGELEPVSNNDGINRLLIRSRAWAIFKDMPSDGGWIHLHHIREILALDRPEPIPESFEIPEQYCLPDEEFHKNLLQQVISSTGELITITGDPGRGKSTYLSYLCQTLDDLDVPSIRHHYFLSTGDHTYDRLSSRVVGDSLLSQISNTYHEIGIDESRTENLRKVLKDCADYYKPKNKPFVIIIDGLDHVWRDNSGDKKPLDHIFKQLLPLPSNIVLIVGTQPVDDKLLPESLLKHSPRKNWYWLPAMTGNAIYEFVNYQVSSGRLRVNRREAAIDDEIKESAEKLTAITSGYPLHVIYSCEYLAQNGKPLSTWEVEKLPPCANSDIESYYLTLWNQLSNQQKDVLHLCCGFELTWPRHDLGVVLNDSPDYPPSINAVAHMLSESRSGVTPFHDSLVVFVTSQEEHDTRVAALTNDTCNWLDTKAQEHLKNEWYWSCLAKMGDIEPLQNGLTRDWVLDRLIEGYSIDTCIRLLTEAETITFRKLQFAKAYRHRELKMRLINGPKFQTWGSINLEALSNIYSPKELIDQKISSIRNHSAVKISTLSISLWCRGETDDSKMLSKYSLRRHRASSKLVNNKDRQETQTEAETIIKAGTLNDTLNYDAMFDDGNFKTWPEGYVKAFVDGCLLKKDIGLLVRAHQCLVDVGKSTKIENAIIRLSLIEDADITSWSDFMGSASGSLNTFLKAFRNKKNLKEINIYLNDNVLGTKVSTNHFDWFFSCLSTRLNSYGDYSWLPIKVESEEVDVTRLFRALTDMATDVGDCIIEEGCITFDQMASMLNPEYLLEGEGWKQSRENIMFQRDWLTISADCHWITNKSAISSDDIAYVVESDIFNSTWLRLWYNDLKHNFLTDEALHLLINYEFENQSSILEETIERSNGNLELAEMAFRHRAPELFNRALRLCWDYVIGYGHHKDRGVFNVLSAINYISESSPQESLSMIKRISPIIYSISAFTDGDETRHSKHSLSQLITKLSPMTMVSKYDQEVREGEWYYANETLTCLLEIPDLDSPFVQALYQTGLTDEQNQKVYRLRDEGNAEAITLTAKISKILGCEFIDEIDDNNNSTTENEDIDIAVEDYPPESMLELDSALSGKYSTRKFWRKWYSYWQENGKEKELVENLLPSILDSDDRLSDKRLLLDDLFISYKRFYGKKRAYKVLAKAQVINSGWSEWYESETKTLKRLKLVSRFYSGEADTFILDTTKNTDDWESKSSGLIIPNDKLVYLLNECGRASEAIELTNAMIVSLEESTRNLPLMQPDWSWGETHEPETLYSKILISRLKWPVPTIKLWANYQLAELLKKHPSHIEALLQKEFSLRTLESECVELLCVFLIAKESGYQVSAEIGASIISRSTLSDMIINQLGLSEYGEYSTDFDPYMITTKHQVGFEKAQGHHVPLVYKSALEREEKRTQLPFVDYYISEWCKTYDYAEHRGSDIDYFFGSDRNSGTGQFYTNLSHRGRSAYLRTLEVAKKCYGMPIDYAEHLATLALPIDMAHLSLLPNIPSWFLNWPYGDDISPENLEAYILAISQNINTLNNSLELGALSFPIKISEDKWLDITITKGLKRYDSDIFPENDRSCGLSVGDKLESEIIYEGNKRIIEGNPVFVPVTGTTFPIYRFGHWHSDMESRGLYVPLSFGDDKKVRGQSSNGVLNFILGPDIIGELGYWHHNWSPVHPKPLRSFCASYTLLDKTKHTKWVLQELLDYEWSYLCEVKYLQREYSYSEFSVSDSKFII